MRITVDAHGHTEALDDDGFPVDLSRCTGVLIRLEPGAPARVEFSVLARPEKLCLESDNTMVAEVER